MMNVRDHNRLAWDRMAAGGSRWSQPVSPEDVAAARAGEPRIFLTPTRPVPLDWLGALAGRHVLCLAGGGGQQGPLLAAAGAIVTVVDLSPQQLARDRAVAAREGLALTLVEGDMADLSAFPDGSFDLIVHPVANLYVPDIYPVWAEAHRVLRPGGELLAGFMNPFVYIFDQDALAEGRLEARHQLPYSELTSISAEERQRLVDEGDALQFSHSLEEQIAGQIAAGFQLVGLFEDRREGHPLSALMTTHLATRARRGAGL